jgi:hypothetical protein
MVKRYGTDAMLEVAARITIHIVGSWHLCDLTHSPASVGIWGHCGHLTRTALVTDEYTP